MSSIGFRIDNGHWFRDIDSSDYYRCGKLSRLNADRGGSHLVISISDSNHQLWFSINLRMVSSDIQLGMDRDIHSFFSMRSERFLLNGGAPFFAVKRRDG